MTTNATPGAGAGETVQQLAASMANLTGLSDSFGKSMTKAFGDAIVQGKQLDGVLRGLATNIVNASLTRALQPFASLIGDGLAGGLGAGLTGLLSTSGGGASGGVIASTDGLASPAYFPAAAQLAESAAGGTPSAGAAVGSGTAPASGGPGGVHVTFNVTTPDTAGFARSEAQVTSMLARAVGRGRRGL